MNENCRVLMVRMSFSDDQNSLSKMYIYEKRREGQFHGDDV